MKKYVFLVLAVSCGFLSSCGRGCSDTTMYEKTGQAKPTVCVLPCIVTQNSMDLGWDLTKEMTEELRRRVFESSKLYLQREEETKQIARALSTPDPRKIPSAPLQELPQSDFVVVTELVEQKQVPYGYAVLRRAKSHIEDSGAVLQLAFRLRVIDKRQGEPKIILQELLDTSQIVPKAYLNSDYHKITWGQDGFQHTPLGMAHSKILREAVAHIEGYILASK